MDEPAGLEDIGTARDASGAPSSTEPHPVHSSFPLVSKFPLDTYR